MPRHQSEVPRTAAGSCATWELINIQTLRRICMLTSSQVIPEHIRLRSQFPYLLATFLPPCPCFYCSPCLKCCPFCLPLRQILFTFLVLVSWTFFFKLCHVAFEIESYFGVRFWGQIIRENPGAKSILENILSCTFSIDVLVHLLLSTNLPMGKFSSLVRTSCFFFGWMPGGLNHIVEGMSPATPPGALQVSIVEFA